VHRREKPGLDASLWQLYAAFSARDMQVQCPTEWKVLLVHEFVLVFKVLHAAKMAFLLFPWHLSHILQAIDRDQFLKTSAFARSELRATLPTLPRNSKFNLADLSRVIKVGAFHGLSSANIINGFKNTGTRPVNPAEISIGRLLLGKGWLNAAWKVGLEARATRLGPEARRDTRQPQLAFRAVSTRVLPLESTASVVLAAFEALDTEASRTNAGKEKVQATKGAMVYPQRRFSSPSSWRPPSAGNHSADPPAPLLVPPMTSRRPNIQNET